MTTFPGIAAEDAAVYGYGVVLATSDLGVKDAARRELAEHRARRDHALRLWSNVPPAPVGYTAAAQTSQDPLLLAIRLESDCCEGWRAQIATATSEEQRQFCSDALTEAAIQMARWRTLIPMAPFEALPGFPRPE